ncbi:alpha/beta fold hydrolase [Frondihabitans australicus]|uniref:Non-heme chloroperoxidase n=1 Tax=Frondihabitans australicus TaxID=386892 RepID=A0A495IK16_9MICO|nr:alpha/beta hydrolase [Frondihabitans australicus]RKR76314.1 non-heme chloroperoxidase [Frondihabitans australicus]
MPYITAKDGTKIHYTDWGTGPVVVLSHGWPLSSEAWAVELMLLADKGYRAIAHDRRGHGKSDWTWDGNDMDTYASDLNDLIEALDLHDITLVGHSTGGGEVVRYAAQHGVGRVKKIFTAGAVPPIMLKSDSNPDGTPIEALDAIREGVATDRSQYFQDLAVPFFGANLEGAKVSQGSKDDFWRQGMRMSIKGAYDCIKAFSETDFTEDLKALDVPIFIAQGDADQIVPIKAAALKSIELVKHGTLKVYPGAPHGIAGDYQKELDQDILAFLAD